MKHRCTFTLFATAPFAGFGVPEVLSCATQLHARPASRWRPLSKESLKYWTSKIPFSIDQMPELSKRGLSPAACHLSMYHSLMIRTLQSSKTSLSKRTRVRLLPSWDLRGPVKAHWFR